MDFVNVSHPRALPTVKHESNFIKHESKFILNQTYVDHEGFEWEGFYAYSSTMGGFVHLLVGIISLPPLRSRHKYPSQFLARKFMDIRCSPHTLQIFSKCYTSNKSLLSQGKKNALNIKNRYQGGWD